MDKLAVSSEKKILLIPVSDLGYIETYGRGCRLHTRGGVFEDSTSIGVFEQKLAGRAFFRIHKSYLVNLDFVAALFPWHGSGFALTLSGFEKEVLPIARGQLKALRSTWDFRPGRNPAGTATRPEGIKGARVSPKEGKTRALLILSYRAPKYCPALLAAMAPSEAAVTSCRSSLERLSPATKTPGTLVAQSSPAWI